MLILIYLLLGALLLGLAVKQMSFILIHGSVFTWLRHAIALRAEHESWVFAKLNELFTCPLCMTTQVSIWTIGVPFAALAITFRWNQQLIYSDMPAAIAIGLAAFEAFLIAMGFGALGLWIWDLAEYAPAKFREERARCDRQLSQQLQAFRGMLASSQKGLGTTSLQMPTPKEFAVMVDYVNTRCDHIGCPMARKYCRAESVSRAVKKWYEIHQPETSEALLIFIEEALGRAMQEYYRRRWKDKAEDAMGQSYFKFQEGLILSPREGAQV